MQLGLVLLSHLLAHPSQLDGFREGVLAGPLTESPEEPLALMGVFPRHDVESRLHILPDQRSHASYSGMYRWAY